MNTGIKILQQIRDLLEQDKTKQAIFVLNLLIENL